MTAAVLLLLWLPSSASALEIKDAQSEVEDNDSFTLTPAILELEVVPDEPVTFRANIFNHTGGTVTFDLRVLDLEANPDPEQFVRSVEEATYGAGSWITVEQPTLTLEHGQTGYFDVRIHAPPDAGVGSHYAALIARPQLPGEPEAQAQLDITGEAVAQLYIDIPGNVQRDGRIAEFRVSERLVFRGTSYATFTVVYENTGTVTDHVGGEIEVTSLFGNTVKRFRLREMLVLRDSRRAAQVLWTDPPPLGRFTAHVLLETDSGTQEADGPVVWVLPPWWWFVIGGILLLIPVTVWWRNRGDDWRQYMDEDWDDEYDEASSV